jgi:hypothetical protein
VGFGISNVETSGSGTTKLEQNLRDGHEDTLV